MATGGRKTQLQAIHEISVQIGPNSGVGGVIGVLPAGAVLQHIRSVVSTPFNSTTNVAAIGTLPPPGAPNLQGGIDLKTLTRTDTAAPAAAATGLCGPYAVDTPIYWTHTITGPAPTVGLWTVWVEYLPGPG